MSPVTFCILYLHEVSFDPSHYKCIYFIGLFKEQVFGIVELFHLFVNLKALQVNHYKSSIYIYVYVWYLHILYM